MLLADLAGGAPAAGIELSVGYLKDSDENPAAARLRAAGVEPSLIRVTRMLDPGSLRRVRASIRAAAPDVVHTHLPTADVLGALAARSLGLPAVSTIHLIDRAVTDPPGLRTELKGRLAARVRRHADARVIAVSDAARDAYLARHRDAATHVVTIHNGVRAPGPGRSREQARSELGIAPDALVLAIVTVLREGKGHDVAIGALERLLPGHPGLRLLVVGDGPDRERVRELARPLGEDVLLAGHRELGEVLPAADVLVHPTRIDAFPTTLLEAAAAGLPAVATAVGGIPEIVDDGVTGVLVTAPVSAVSLAGALEPLLADPRLRERLGGAARERYEREFSAERWAQRLRALYERVLDERADGAG
jgi:glycosyltransferase involved in cell wall biosynthesis